MRLINMHKKQHTGFQDFWGPNSGTWMLIFVHLAILVAIVVIFSNIIEKMANF